MTGIHLRQYSDETEGGNYQHAKCNLMSLICVCVDPKISTCQWTAGNKMTDRPLDSHFPLEPYCPLNLESHFSLESQSPTIADCRRGIRTCNNKNLINRLTRILNRVAWPQTAWITTLQKGCLGRLSSRVQPCPKVLGNYRMPMWLDLRKDKGRDITSAPRPQKEYSTAMVIGL